MARFALGRTVPFTRLGWRVIAGAVNQHGDVRANVEGRRTVTEGSTYLISGLLWGLVSFGCGGAAALFWFNAVGHIV